MKRFDFHEKVRISPGSFQMDKTHEFGLERVQVHRWPAHSMLLIHS